MEKRIEDGEFSPLPLDDALLFRFHSLICGDFVPQLSGWRRTNVIIGKLGRGEHLALRATDGNDWKTLMDVWRGRLSTKEYRRWLKTGERDDD